MSLSGLFSRRSGRALIALATAYAIAIQGLLIGLAGPTLVAEVNAASPGFVLCHQDGQDRPALPTDAPDHFGCSQCILCFAAAHQALASPASVAIVHRAAEAANLSWPNAKRRAPARPAHAIAEPRGPPAPA